MNKFISRNIYSGQTIWQRPFDDWKQGEKQLSVLCQLQKTWEYLPVTERTKKLSCFAEKLFANKETLSQMICEEVGRCLPECRAELDKSIDLIRYYSHLAPELLSRKTIATQARLSQVAFEPLGVVLAVMPWNYPVWQILRFAIPALCAGNACWVKPAPTVGRVSEALFNLMDEDLPCKLAWLSHDDIEMAIGSCDALAFTGSAQTGKHLASIAGKYLKKCVLELGGSNAFIVLSDANLETAATDACHSRFRDAGQSCNAAKRIILVDEIADKFLEYFLLNCQKLTAGNPQDISTSLALLHLPQAAQQMQSLVDDAVSKGAKCVVGGSNGTQHSYPATVLDQVPQNARVAQEEVFGPIATIIRAKNVHNAIELSNDTPFGLGACVYTADTDKAWEIARQLKVGSVFINRHTSSDLRLPFGGVKASGFGRELSEFGLYEFVNVKTYWQK